MKARLCAFFFAIQVLNAQVRPSPSEIGKLIASVREAALAYDSRLPDFICTQTTRREERDNSGLSATGNGWFGRALATMEAGWKTVDSMDQQLTYFKRQESYRILAVNGKAVSPDKQTDPGLITSGEFGSTLRSVFEPASFADIKWIRREVLRGRPMQVFSYSVRQEDSVVTLAANKSKVVVGYRGLVYVDRETNQVMRLTTEPGVPPNFPLQDVTRTLDYGRVTIVSEQYLVPLRAETELTVSRDYLQGGKTGKASAKVHLRNTVDFKAYRKYRVESAFKPE